MRSSTIHVFNVSWRLVITFWTILWQKGKAVEITRKWFMINCKWNTCGWICVLRRLGGPDKGVSPAFEGKKRESVGVCEYFNHDSFSRILNTACFYIPRSLGLYLQHDGRLHALLNSILLHYRILREQRNSRRSSLEFPRLTWVWFVIVPMLLWPLLFWKHVASWLLYCLWEIFSHIKS